jgi:hypothetical protein
MARMAVSEHIKDILVTAGYQFNLSVPTDWNIWIGKQPDGPIGSVKDRTITVYDAGGRTPDPKWLLDFPSIQVRVRGGPNDYVVAHNKAHDVRGALLGIPSFTASNGDRIDGIRAIGGVAFAGWDEKQRPQHVFNLSLIVEPAPQTGDQREPLPA